MARLDTRLPSEGLNDSVDTIWQCTVPNNIIRHIGPNTSLAVAAGTSINSTAAATVKETLIQIQQHLLIFFFFLLHKQNSNKNF